MSDNRNRRYVNENSFIGYLDAVCDCSETIRKSATANTSLTVRKCTNILISTSRVDLELLQYDTTNRF